MAEHIMSAFQCDDNRANLTHQCSSVRAVDENRSILCLFNVLVTWTKIMNILMRIGKQSSEVRPCETIYILHHTKGLNLKSDEKCI